MRPAPPLALRCPASRAWRLACVAVGAAAGAAFAAWLAGHLEWALPATTVGVGLATAVGAALGLAGAGPGRPTDVAWDGRDWRVDDVPGALYLMLDLGHVLLLLRHHQPQAVPRRRRWIAVSFPRGADDLRALRTALYSLPPEDTSAEPHVRVPGRDSD